MIKIIGFLITKENKTPEIDVFDSGLTLIKKEHNGYSVYVWGMGDINQQITNSLSLSLSFPLNDSLLDRNVLVRLNGNEIIIENDWLGSIPVFYNTRECVVSTVFNLCVKNKAIDTDGLANFCEFGYSVFEHTIFEDVKFMRYYSKLSLGNETLKIVYKNDPVLEPSFKSDDSTEDCVIEKIQGYVSNIESTLSGDIVIPTSGGYDSRILNYFVNNKSKIRSFTYGVSKQQHKSSEVVFAKKISEIYKTKWKQVELVDFLSHIDDWFSIYGASTHLHGMYHIEFYTKIIKDNKLNHPSLLSGIIGDAWAGYGKFGEITRYEDLVNIGFTHSMNVETCYLTNRQDNKIKQYFFSEHKDFLANEKIRTIFAMRVKLMLISYLTQIPEYLSMPVWTPFLSFDVVKAIINLPDEKRVNRLWQKDFFTKVGLNLEDMNLKSSESNKLDYEIARESRLPPLDVELLREHIKESKLVEINAILASSKPSFLQSIVDQLYYTPKIRGILRLFGFKKTKLLQALHEYYVLKSIEKGLTRG